MNLDHILETLSQTLNQHISTKTVIGDAVTIGDVTLIPVMDLAFGFGAGGGEGTSDTKETGTGSGGGGGARLSPKAVIVVQKGEATVLPLSKGSAIDKIVEAIPDVMAKVKISKDEPTEEEKKDD